MRCLEKVWILALSLLGFGLILLSVSIIDFFKRKLFLILVYCENLNIKILILKLKRINGRKKMALDPIIISSGIFSIVYVIVSVILSLRMALRYRFSKKKTHLLVGLAFLGMSRIFWASSISFLSLLITGNGLPLFIYILIAYPFQSIFLILCLIGLNDLMDISNYKIFIVIIIAIIFIFEAIIIYYCFTDTSVIAVFVNPVDIAIGLITITYLLLILGLFVFSGIVFAFELLPIEKPETKLKGKFLLLAFVLFVIRPALAKVLGTRCFFTSLLDETFFEKVSSKLNYICYF